jgi:hypothetical protein
MAKHNEWSVAVPRLLYESYPDQDLLPIESPKPGETIAEFKLRAEDAGDTLFLFLCREADDEIDADEYIARLDRAMRDIEAVRAAFSASARPALPESLASAAQAAMMRLTLDRDWIEVALSGPDAQGKRWGRVTSSLHASNPDEDRFNAAMDAVESMVLGHACAGIDVADPRYVDGLRMCLEACANNL